MATHSGLEMWITFHSWGPAQTLALVTGTTIEADPFPPLSTSIVSLSFILSDLVHFLSSDPQGWRLRRRCWRYLDH